VPQAAGQVIRSIPLLFRPFAGGTVRILMAMRARLRPVMTRIIDRLPEEQQCAILHWIDHEKHRARRRETWNVGEGAHTVTYSLRGFDEHRCIFVHIPKAAGISVAMALFGNLAGGHNTARHYRVVFGPDFWRYFKFTFVRNPYTRLVSAYEFLRSGGHPAWPTNQRFRDEVLSQYADFEDFVLRWLRPGTQWPEPHFRPQHEFLELGGRIVMDFVGRVERIQNDFATVSDRLGIPAQLERLNPTVEKKESLGSYYSNDAVERRVREVYAKDFELFDYPLRPPTDA
jgi:chondroitin 4-sulfotransferase 11